ncbi:MAG: hypothetical protein U1C97_02510, partial [Candidatus Gracilibacteria bacterium]|nr:hypothetical protein [Candidatus Gracilibacteria bacterium]
MKLNFRTDRNFFSSWQRAIALLLSVILLSNTGLFSGVVYAQTYEVRLDDFRSSTPQDLNEYALVNVLVEGALMEDRDIANHVDRYCQNVNAAIGAMCVITQWNGETPSRIVEALQQLYFEGKVVSDGIGKLVGLVIV